MRMLSQVNNINFGITDQYDPKKGCGFRSKLTQSYILL